MATPPVPPRPYDAYEYHPARNQSGPPPVPPIPPALKMDLESEYGSAPHFEDPLVAPRPHKLQPDLPANMARTLHEQTSSSYGGRYSGEYARPYGGQPTVNAAPGFAMPSQRDPTRGASPLPGQGASYGGYGVTSPPPGGYSPYPPQGYSAQVQYYPPPNTVDVQSSLAALALGPSPQPQAHHHHRHHSSMSASYVPPPPPAQQYPASSQPGSPPRQPAHTQGPPSLTAPLPTVSGLAAALQAVQQPNYDPAKKVAWCRDVLALVNRAEALQAPPTSPTNIAATDIPVGPVRIEDPQLRPLVDVMTSLILQIASLTPMPKPPPVHVAEAVYLRACCEASGAFASAHPPIKRDPRTAFRDFEFAARNGFPAAWFKIGRDYENFGDVPHAKDAFDRGVKAGDERCLYRMGMAHLMGQLGLPPSPETAVSLLHRAATLASVDVPQPAYVYGLLLLQEFTHVTIPPQLFAPFVPAGSSLELEARKHLERAAYLNFAPAQYKLGHSYEFATPPFPFDALLSVQYYSLASQQGEIEADMALSKWFLCGSEGAFEKDEGLAWTFAEKAAKKGLPSAEFAMGYYAEVGVGGPKDMEVARMWYQKAADHGNEDAQERLRSLSQPAPQAISREEHQNLTEVTLVRKRTQAKQRSDASGARPPEMSAGQGQRIVEHARNTSTSQGPAVAVAPHGAPSPQPQPAMSPRRRPADMPPTGPPAGSPGPSPGPQGQAGRPFANAPRYALSDPGANSAAGPRPTQQQQQSNFGPPGRRNDSVPSQPSGPGPEDFDEPPPPRNDPPRRGAQTFAEMGITTAKVEEKECVIM